MKRKTFKTLSGITIELGLSTHYLNRRNNDLVPAEVLLINRENISLNISNVVCGYVSEDPLYDLFVPSIHRVEWAHTSLSYFTKIPSQLLSIESIFDLVFFTSKHKYGFWDEIYLRMDPETKEVYEHTKDTHEWFPIGKF